MYEIDPVKQLLHWIQTHTDEWQLLQGLWIEPVSDHDYGRLMKALADAKLYQLALLAMTVNDRSAKCDAVVQNEFLSIFSSAINEERMQLALGNIVAALA